MRDTIASLRLPSCVPRPCARKDARNIACRACSPCRNVSIRMFFVCCVSVHITILRKMIAEVLTKRVPQERSDEDCLSD